MIAPVSDLNEKQRIINRFTMSKLANHCTTRRTVLLSWSFIENLIIFLRQNCYRPEFLLSTRFTAVTPDTDFAEQILSIDSLFQWNKIVIEKIF